MQVVVEMAGELATVSLSEPADCGRFHVAVRGSGDAATLDRALRSNGVGSVDGDGEALVRVDAVRSMAAGAVGGTWEDDFAAMLDYARSKGWLSDDGSSIRAHVEWG
jgi:hypothetical protein